MNELNIYDKISNKFRYLFIILWNGWLFFRFASLFCVLCALFSLVSPFKEKFICRFIRRQIYTYTHTGQRVDFSSEAKVEIECYTVFYKINNILLIHSHHMEYTSTTQCNISWAWKEEKKKNKRRNKKIQYKIKKNTQFISSHFSIGQLFFQLLTELREYEGKPKKKKKIEIVEKLKALL